MTNIVNCDLVENIFVLIDTYELYFGQICLELNHGSRIWAFFELLFNQNINKSNFNQKVQNRKRR